MNTRTRFAATLVSIVTTCVIAAGAASAQPPTEPTVVPTTSADEVASHSQAVAKSRAKLLLARRSYAAHMERVFAERAAAAARSREAGQYVGVGQGTSRLDPGKSAARASTTQPSSQQSGDGSEVPLLAVTALAGLALGAGGTAASRRLRHRPRIAT